MRLSRTKKAAILLEDPQIPVAKEEQVIDIANKSQSNDPMAREVRIIKP